MAVLRVSWTILWYLLLGSCLESHAKLIAKSDAATQASRVKTWFSLLDHLDHVRVVSLLGEAGTKGVPAFQSSSLSLLVPDRIQLPNMQRDQPGDPAIRE